VTYLASPYSHSDPAVREERFHAACRATADLVRAGEVVFSPVVYSHPLVRFGLPTGWGYWEWFDWEVLARCDQVALLTLDGWEASEGVRAEMAIAGELGIPVRYLAVVGPGTPTSAPVASEGGR
jgi:Domain of unknown function (DUF1937)